MQLWETLGLSIKCVHVRYATETINIPNLYFEVEHADKSCALLSPPEMRTSTMDGIVCLFIFDSISSVIGNDDSVECQRNEDEYGGSEEEHFYGNMNTPEPAYHARYQPADTTMVVDSLNGIQQHPETMALGFVRQYRQTAELAIAALHKIIGVKRRSPGIRLGSRLSTTLLQLAPAVWNAHYMQVSDLHLYSLVHSS
jgi:hypothetical protein